MCVIVVQIMESKSDNSIGQVENLQFLFENWIIRTTIKRTAIDLWRISCNVSFLVMSRVSILTSNNERVAHRGVTEMLGLVA